MRKVAVIGAGMTLFRRRLKETGKELSELKTKTEELEREMIRIKDTLSSIIEELQNFARKNETEILRKQFKMFQPFLEK